MKQKLIGFTARVLYEGSVRKQFVNERYLVAMQKHGFNTIMLTLDNPHIDSILDLCDAFVVTGGSDIDPAFFDEENTGESKNCDMHLDQLDKDVVEYAAKHQKPLLGICRGHQAINVFLGGSLVQDIGNHHQNTRHKVQSFQNRYFQFPETFETNSYHHQSIKKTANDLEIIAVSSDQVIEAVIHKTLPILGFQWHPEMIQDEAISQEIFSVFANLINH